MVVSVHPLCQDLPLKILSSLDSDGKSRLPEARKTPFCTVVTDLAGAHPTWFNPKVDKCFVPTKVLYQCALDRGLDKSQIVLDGLPIRKGFWSTESFEQAKGKRMAVETEMRRKLGIDEDLPTVLVVGGGDGMGGIERIATVLGDKLGKSADELSYQMIVVCGSNENARKRLSALEWGDGVDVTPTGFVQNMDEWMKASDVLVTKAGPGTIAEASICGLPCMLFNYL
jgi:1,2-diacylglycerol 3-beta-galactosyltransferase